MHVISSLVEYTGLTWEDANWLDLDKNSAQVTTVVQKTWYPIF